MTGCRSFTVKPKKKPHSGLVPSTEFDLCSMPLLPVEYMFREPARQRMSTELNAQRADQALRVVGLAIWRQLYAMVWLAFLQIIIAVANIPSSNVFLVYGHVILGLVILGLAHYNNAQFKKTEAPNRLKRIVKSTAILATIQVLLGIPILVNIMRIFGIPMVWIISLLHLVIALAIITQASSAATAYDMWEEKEYTKS